MSADLIARLRELERACLNEAEHAAEDSVLQHGWVERAEAAHHAADALDQAQRQAPEPVASSAPDEARSLLARLIAWHDARFVPNLGQPFADILAESRALIATPPPAPTEGR